MPDLSFNRFRPYPVNTKLQILPNCESLVLVNSDGLVGLYTYLLDPSKPTFDHYMLGSVMQYTQGGATFLGFPIEAYSETIKAMAMSEIEDRRAHIVSRFLSLLRSGRTVIVNGKAMSLHDQESSSPSSHRGYGGAIWNFETSDGRQFSSSNVWDNGELPTEWEIPDNVRTMTPRETFPELPDSELVWEPIPDTLTSKEVIITMAKKPAKPVKSKPCK